MNREVSITIIPSSLQPTPFLFRRVKWLRYMQNGHLTSRGKEVLSFLRFLPLSSLLSLLSPFAELPLLRTSKKLGAKYLRQWEAHARTHARTWLLHKHDEPTYHGHDGERPSIVGPSVKPNLGIGTFVPQNLCQIVTLRRIDGVFKNLTKKQRKQLIMRINLTSTTSSMAAARLKSVTLWKDVFSHPFLLHTRQHGYHQYKIESVLLPKKNGIVDHDVYPTQFDA